MLSLKNRKHPSKQNVKIAVDNCIFTVKDDQLYILLIQMKKKPFTKKWALPGGLIQEDERLHEAARRILQEETGVADVYMEQLYAFSRLDRDPFGRVISVGYYALIPDSGINLRAHPKYAAVQWWQFSQLPKLAYDHNEIVKYAIKRLEDKLGSTNIVWSLLPPKFTLTNLQKVYEAVLRRQLDKRNFRRKILSLDLIEATKEKTSGQAHRPARLYRFKTRKVKIVDML
jgi:8-oxo-dGTP diphosphatase